MSKFRFRYSVFIENEITAFLQCLFYESINQELLFFLAVVWKPYVLKSVSNNVALKNLMSKWAYIPLAG